MFTNYLKIAWRNLTKNKTFTIINITGLAIGLCCFILIALFVLDEWSYDRYHEKAGQIYRINCDLLFNGTELHLAVSSDMAGSTLKKDYPQVLAYTRIFDGGSKLIKKGNEFINERAVAHVDSTFFDVFTYPGIGGDPHRALDEPNSVVLTERAAKKYFGTTDVLGKSIETNDNQKTIYKITAVIRDMPSNSHFHFDFLFSMKNVSYDWGNYLSNNFFTYIVLDRGVDPRAFEKNFRQYILKYVMPQAAQMMQIKSLEDFEKGGNKLSYSLIPLTRIHLYDTNRNPELSPPGNIQYVYIFGAVALFVLIIACINFMNLTTARSANRAKEVGIRKVLGTEKKGLILQFLSESILMVFLSLGVALGLAAATLPFFNSIAHKSMELGSLFTARLLPAFIIFPLLVGLLAGIYPSFYLSRFKPVQVLKGNLTLGSKRSGFRTLLVVFQFATSIVLIIGTLIIYGQLHFIQTTNPGFNKNQVLIIDQAYALKNQVDAFKNEVLRMPGVSMGTVTSYLPVASSRTDFTYSKTPVMDTRSGFDLQVWAIDQDYLPTLGMTLLKGRNFSREFADSNSVIINETTMNVLGYDDPIGKKIYEPGSPGEKLATALTIIGVVKNFHFESMREHIGPLCFRLGLSTGMACFKVQGANLPQVLRQAESKWKAMARGIPFSYRFLDESFNDLYRSEQRIGKIVLTFSILAIFIACLGLFGLAAFVAEQRSREIGIRKVLGASVQGIVELLSREFMLLVLISFLIAIPLGWYFMNKWLQDFAYRIQISWWVFAVAGVLAFVIALVTISFQAIRAALANPVNSLRGGS